MILAVNNPRVSKVQDGASVSEFKENELDDTSLLTVLSQAYKLFKLFNGSFTGQRKQYGEEGLKQKLDAFFSSYLQSMIIDEIDLFSTLDGIHFLPVDKNVYLRIQCFINLCEQTFPKIQYSTFLYRDHLVWSGLEQEETRILYRYLVNHLAPSLAEGSQSNAAPADSNNNNTKTGTFVPINRVREGFVTGPSANSENASLNVPTVYLTANDKPYSMVIFTFKDITYVFLIDPSGSSDLSFYKTVGSFVMQQLDFLAPILEDHYLRKQGFEDQYRYIYFNHMNFALKTSISKGLVIPRETMKMLNDIHADFEKSVESVSEVLIRTQNDRWVVGRKSDQREFYVIFDHKNSHLIEINEEVKKLSSTYFNNIFID